MTDNRTAPATHGAPTRERMIELRTALTDAAIYFGLNGKDDNPLRETARLDLRQAREEMDDAIAALCGTVPEPTLNESKSADARRCQKGLCVRVEEHDGYPCNDAGCKTERDCEREFHRRCTISGTPPYPVLRAPEVADEEKRRAVEVFWRTVKADATLPSAVGVEAALEDFIAQRKGATEEAAESAELDQADCEGARTVNRTVTTGREDAKS